jgi:hypothetical protein
MGRGKGRAKRGKGERAKRDKIYGEESFLLPFTLFAF